LFNVFSISSFIYDYSSRTTFKGLPPCTIAALLPEYPTGTNAPRMTGTPVSG